MKLTKAAIVKLESDRAGFETEYQGLKSKVGPLENAYDKFNQDIASLIARLNAAMNDCKRIELLLKRFDEESKVNPDKTDCFSEAWPPKCSSC